MTLLLDTSIIIDMENDHKSTLNQLEAILQRYPAAPRISFMTYFEFLDGLRARGPNRREKALSFVEQFEIVQTTKMTAVLISQLKDRYGGFPFSDLFIAAQAAENHLVLVARDRIFERIKEVNTIMLA